MPALVLTTTRRAPANPGQAKGFARALGAFLMGCRGSNAEVPDRARDIAPGPTDLIHENRPTDRYDEYRRRAVERVLAACPYQL